jgi:hypothetical protein
MHSPTRFHGLDRKPLTSIKKIGPAPSLSVSGCESPILSSWFKGGRSATARAVSFSLSRPPPVSGEQGQQSDDRCQPGGRWSLFPGSRRMVATTTSISLVYSPPSACVVKTRASSRHLDITQGIAGPWPVVVAAEGALRPSVSPLVSPYPLPGSTVPQRFGPLPTRRCSVSSTYHHP